MGEERTAKVGRADYVTYSIKADESCEGMVDAAQRGPAGT
jgi:hypothetical protein